MMPFFKELLVAVVAASLLSPATAVAKQSDGKRQLKVTVHPKYAAKNYAAKHQRWRGYGFLPGYRQPLPLTEWRDRSPRYGGGYDRYDRRYVNYYGQLSYGWGGARFYQGRWNGGSFGPCWTYTPIGMIWNCGD